MSKQDDIPPLVISFSGHVVPTMAPDAPYVPSDIEARNYYYGLLSKPRLIARSSSKVWMQPMGPEAYLDPKGLAPLSAHPLANIWEEMVGPEIAQYLVKQGFDSFSLTPVRVETTDDTNGSAVVLLGVEPGSLTHERGIAIAIHCHSILISRGISDVHVEIGDSKALLAAALYEPSVTSGRVASFIEPFSTSLGLPICSTRTTYYEGTAGFFFTTKEAPGKLFMLTARHVLFHPDNEANEMYVFKGECTGMQQRKVMLLGRAAFNSHVKEVEKAVAGQHSLLTHLQQRLDFLQSPPDPVETDVMEDKDEDTKREWERFKARKRAEIKREVTQITAQQEEAQTALGVFEELLVDIRRDWHDEENRVIGHVVCSPPIACNFGSDGFTDDWAVVEIHPRKISKLNFIGNAIDLGSVDTLALKEWMSPHPTNPHSFDYPIDRLLRFSGKVQDQEILRRSPSTKDQDDNPVIMVLKNGNTSGLTIGRLNTIRSFVRYYFKGQPGETSREIAVLQRSLKSGAFSAPGDSGSVVVDGKGRVCGILTGGDSAIDVSDITYITSIDFLLRRLQDFGIKANIFPTLANL